MSDPDDSSAQYDEPAEMVSLTGVDLAVMELRPDYDHTLVVMSDEPLDQRQRIGIRAMLADQFPELAGEDGRRVLILDNGKRLAVVSRQRPEPKEQVTDG